MIGIIAAMQKEVDALLPYMEQVKQVQIDRISFWQGEMNQKSVVLMLSGVGKGNAAMSTTIMIKSFPIKAIINIGTAGGLKNNQNVLDLVISTQVVQHDYDTSPIDQEEGIGLWFEVNKTLLNISKNACESLKCNFHCGLIASGDRFISRDEDLQQLLMRFPNAICAEMEAGSIAQVCNFFQIPFIVIRSLSDIAWKEKSELDFNSYVALASKNSAKLCNLMLNQL